MQYFALKKILSIAHIICYLIYVVNHSPDAYRDAMEKQEIRLKIESLLNESWVLDIHRDQDRIEEISSELEVLSDLLGHDEEEPYIHTAVVIR